MSRTIHRSKVHLNLISYENPRSQLVCRNSQKEQTLFLVLWQLVEQISRLSQEPKGSLGIRFAAFDSTNSNTSLGEYITISP